MAAGKTGRRARMRPSRAENRPPGLQCAAGLSAKMEDRRNTMRRIIAGVIVSVLLGGFTGSAAQLLPEIKEI